MDRKDKDTLKRLRETAAQDVRFFLPEAIMSRWQPDVMAANDDDESTINIYDIVGYDWWTGQGMTAKIVSSVLRKNKGNEITVNINSPGGDFHEGLAIYNLLKEHDAPVTVRIVGMAASAASVVAMAGTTIKIAEAGYFMIHNSWTCVCGNKNDMRSMADVLSQFDETMAGVYSRKTGIDAEEISSMMDKDTWINGADAVDQGFATQLLDSDELDKPGDVGAKYNSSLKEVDVALAKAGKTRSQRRAILKDLTSTPGATVNKPTTSSAGEKSDDLANALTSFIENLKT